MTCRRVSEIDVEAFLIDSTASEFDAFRTHYPQCADCAEAVADWTALELALAAELGVEQPSEAAHPSSDLLGRFAMARSELADEAVQIEAHLARCTACETEVALMAGFDAAALCAETEPATRRLEAAASEPAGPSLWEACVGLLESAAQALFAPGIGRLAVLAAIVLIAVVSVPLLLEDEAGVPLDDATRLAERDPAPSEPKSPIAEPPDPGPISEAPERAPIEVAEAAPGPEPPPSDPSRVVAPSPLDTPDSAPGEEAPPEEILLASLDGLPPVVYESPGAGRVDWMDAYFGVRAAATPGVPGIRALAPRDHPGQTLARSPRLWWSLSQATELDVEILVTAPESVEPVLLLSLPGPHRSGFYVVDLEREGVSLESGVDYQWFASLVVDPNHPTRNPVSPAALRVVSKDDPRHARVATGAPAERGHRLASEGAWYDALDFFAELAEHHPDTSATAHRDHLLREVRADDADAASGSR